MKTKAVIEQLKNGKSIDDLVISDLETTQIQFRDALLLTEHGFQVPAGNIVYNEDDIAFDPDFDEVEWTGQFKSLTEALESEGIYMKGSEGESITIELSVEDDEIRAWLNQNSPKLSALMSKLVVDLYHTEKILHSK